MYTASVKSPKRTAALILRLSSELHAAAKTVAQRERRSLNNTLNYLIEIGLQSFKTGRKNK